MNKRLSVQEMAELLGVSTHWVYEATGAQRLPHSKVGRYTRFTPADVARIERQTHVEPRTSRPLRSA